ncbi:hypothetical protein BT93_K1445 [Corymbia citriodora subsp. variegata]|nr:hypothetical protein BT93_K1445 [Corymbia citriodora subsp. variegata]
MCRSSLPVDALLVCSDVAGMNGEWNRYLSCSMSLCEQVNIALVQSAQMKFL